LPVHRGLALDDDDIIRAEVIQQLMCSGVIDRAGISARHDIDFDEYFADALLQLVPLAGDGLVEVDERHIVATSRGRLMLRIIAMCFDRYISAQATPMRHSRAL
jgi:oxygen-independent coproporphyrinogen-3 oxidase